MQSRLLILTLLILVTLHVRAAETAALPEPGPEDGGLRMRLVVAPRTDTGQEGFDVCVDLLNTSERAITLRAGWRHADAGDLNDYIDAATSIDCVPGGSPVDGRSHGGPAQVAATGTSPQAR
jgi:hypothetical protein